MNRRDRSRIDDLLERAALFVVQERRVAGRLTINEAGGPIGVEGQHPITDRLQPNATELRSLGSRTAIVDQRQREKPTRLTGIRRPFRQPAQLSRIVVASKSNSRCHGKPQIV
jgi:hypothetical protein